MSCSEAPRELITFWLAGSLSPADAALVSSHVESCAECRAAAVEGLAVVRGFSELHLTAEEVVAAAAGGLDAPHVLVCSHCRDEVSLLRTVNADLDNTSDRSGWLARLVDAYVRPAPLVPARRWRPLGVAALVAATVIVAVWVVPLRQTGDNSTVRGPAPAAVDLLPVTIGADGVPAFGWTPLAAATRYRIDLFTDDGRPVWVREVEAPPVLWPNDVPRAAGAYRWTVEALAGTEVVARSRLAELELTR